MDTLSPQGVNTVGGRKTMRRFVRIIALAVAAVGGVVVWPGARQATPVAHAVAASNPDVIAVNVRGTGQRVPSAPDRFVRTVDLLSMTGEKLGTATRDFAFTGPSTGDDVMTFHFRDGDLVSRSVLIFSPASSDPGFFFVGSHPEASTIVPERGNGAYAGRTGRLRMAGWHDGRAFPEQAGFDDFFVIELGPKA